MLPDWGKAGIYPLQPWFGKDLSPARAKLKRLSCFRDFSVYDQKMVLSHNINN